MGEVRLCKRNKSRIVISTAGYFLKFCSGLLLLACVPEMPTRPKDILNDEEFREFLKESHWAAITSPADKAGEVYAELIQKFHTSDEKIMRTYDYYFRSLPELVSTYEEILEQLLMQSDSLKKQMQWAQFSTWQEYLMYIDTSRYLTPILIDTIRYFLFPETVAQDSPRRNPIRKKASINTLKKAPLLKEEFIN